MFLCYVLEQKTLFSLLNTNPTHENKKVLTEPLSRNSYNIRDINYSCVDNLTLYCAIKIF